MTDAVLLFALPNLTATPRCERQIIHGRLGGGGMIFSRSSSILSNKLADMCAIRKRGVDIKNPIHFSGPGHTRSAQRDRRMITKAQEEEGDGRPSLDDVKPFYETINFWLQAAVVTFTFGFIDAGYSGDWSRVGALSQDTEAQLRAAAYLVVPLSTAVVFAIGKGQK